MSWIGKIIGGTLGFVFGGPLGMIAGAALGHLFDKSTSLEFHNSSEPGPESQYYGEGMATESDKRQMIYFVSVFSMLAKLCTADGKLNDKSTRTVQKFINENMGSGTDSAKLANNVFSEAIQSPYTFESFAKQFYSYFGGDSSMLVTMMHMLFQVSMADGSMTAAEENMIDNAGMIFRFSFFTLNSFKRQYQFQSSNSGYSYDYTTPPKPKASNHSYDVLGLTEDASDEEVKKAYHKLSIEYHPDMVASKGLPAEFSKFATEKFKEINSAYQEIKKERGIK